jgi:hypothetical protein
MRAAHCCKLIATKQKASDGYRYFTTRLSIKADNPKDMPFARITGRSPITIPWMNQRKIPADSENVVHGDMSLDSFNRYIRMICGMLEKVVSRAAIYPIAPNP